MHARMSMRWTVTLFTAFFLTVSLSLVLVAMMHKSHRQWMQDAMLQARSAASLVASASRNALRRGDTAALGHFVREASAEGTVRRVIVADKNGRIIADSRPGAAAPVLLRGVLDRGLLYHTVANRESAEVVAPVLQKGEILGVVYADVSLREHLELLGAMYHWGLLMLLVTVVVACATAYAFAAIVSRPLQRVAQEMQRVAEGLPVGPLEEIGCCEVRRMARSFNGMARSLQRRLAEMENLRSLGVAVSRSLDLCTVVETAVRTMEATFTGCRVRIWLLNADGKCLVEGCRGVTAEDGAAVSSETALWSEVLQHGQPVIAGNRSDTPLDSWLAEYYGASSLIAVPLLAGSETVGVLVAFRTDGELFTPEDVLYFHAAGNEIALALQNARMFSRESHVAQVFQSILRPQTPGFITGLEIAVRWRPATDARVGGDYYDFIALPQGRWGIVIGDVCGKGTLAASYTAMAKYALRSFAYETDSPSEILRRTNGALYAQLRTAEPREGAPSFITMLCGICEPASGRFVYSHAGHPHGTLARADARAAVVLDQGGPPVGVVPDATYREDVLYLRPGDSLALYTDGVAEASRNEELIEPGRIAEILRANQENSVDAAADAVIAEAVSAAGGEVSDDITLLVLRLRDPLSSLPTPTTTETRFAERF